MLLGIDTLLNSSWHIYQKYFASFLHITAVMFIPAVVLAVWTGLDAWTGTLNTWVNIGVIALLALVAFIFGLWGSLALLCSVQRILKDGTAFTVGQAYHASRPLLLPYVWIGIVMAVIILLYIAVPLVLGLLLLSPSIGILGNVLPNPSNFVTFIASALIAALAIAGIVVAFAKSISFSQAYYLLLEKDLRGLAALHASQDLVQGYWWAILGRFVVLGLALALLQAIVTGIFGLFGDIWAAVAQIVFNVIVAPFSIIYSYHVFRSLRAAKPQA